mmetsp:Transcript_70456/g.184727  ORF Transcript_70456/g.184727 Transcript_70456/m.184727 type:complete len:589 (+) Transcript_70456:31-1797(+)
MGCGDSKPAAAAAAAVQPQAAPAMAKSAAPGATVGPEQWRVKLGAEMPNFACVTTKGDFNFHDFLGSDPKRPFTVLFSHPKDFTPVCTTELGTCERLVPDFDRRSVKMIGISCDPVEEHVAWSKDILARAKIESSELSFPIISDASKALVTMLGMIDPEEIAPDGVALPARSLILVGPDRRVRLSILYPATTGRNFDEVLRAIDSVQLTAVHSLATPANWKRGERCIVAPVLPTEDAKAKFLNFEQREMPSGRPYLRTVDCPTDPVVVPEVATPAPPGPVWDEALKTSEAPTAWKVKLGAEVPNFECVATTGPTMFHQFLDGDSERPWTVLFTHPKDFTPVCTTELGTCQLMAPEFNKRGVKMIGLSCDSVDMHTEWSKDILHNVGEKKGELVFPMIADTDKSIVTLLGMLDPSEKDAEGLPLPARALLLIGPDKKVRLSILYPATTGRNFDEVLRAVDSVFLTAKHSLATPADWKQGERCVVAPVLPTEDAEARFSNLVIEDLPSGKQYLRMVDCPPMGEAAETSTTASGPAEPKQADAYEIRPLIDEGADREQPGPDRQEGSQVATAYAVEPPEEGGGGMFACCTV